MRNRYGVIMPPQYEGSDDFFVDLRSHLKFSIYMLLVFTVLLIIFWNWQPWFRIIPVTNAIEILPNPENDALPSGAMLQSNVRFRGYTVQAAESLSEIAERFGVGVSALQKYNALADPNLIRVGQRLKIPQR
jgi:hypothetical protein